MLGVSGSREWRDERAERCVVKAKPTALTDTYWRRMQEGWRGSGFGVQATRGWCCHLLRHEELKGRGQRFRGNYLSM